MKGLYGKYTVINNETGERVENCFVLKPGIDFAASMAVYEYINRIRPKNETLAKDLEQWLKSLRMEGMNGTNCKYKARLAEVEDESANMIRSLEQQLEQERELSENIVDGANRGRIRLEQQVNTLTEALEQIFELRNNIRPDGEAWEYIGEFNDAMRISRKALQSIKESPREEQGK